MWARSISAGGTPGRCRSTCGRTGCTAPGTRSHPHWWERSPDCCSLHWRPGTWAGASSPDACDDRRMTIALLFLALAAADAGRPALFFREDFKETPAATPITQEH